MARFTAGRSSAARIAMMPITTSISVKVKPGLTRREESRDINQFLFELRQTVMRLTRRRGETKHQEHKDHQGVFLSRLVLFVSFVYLVFNPRCLLRVPRVSA